MNKNKIKQFFLPEDDENLLPKLHKDHSQYWIKSKAEALSNWVVLLLQTLSVIYT